MVSWACTASRSREVILSHFLALVRAHVEHSVQCWAPHYRRDTGILERSQQRARKMV